MKKLISFALAIVMIMCLSTTAFATTVEAPGDYTAEVTGSYVAGNESNGIVYCVDIAWNDLDFTYHAEKGAVWHTDTLTYSEVKPAYWEGEGTITVTNRSNTKISAKPTYNRAEGYEDAGMDFSTSDLSVASAESGTAQSGTITVTPNGFLPAMDEAATIGTITLTIAQGNITVEDARALLDAVEELEDEWYAKGGDSSDADYSDMNTNAAALRTFLQSNYTSDQNSLNELYKNALDAYNAFKAKMAALS